MNDQARVLFFATLRDITGVRECTVEFPRGSNIADFKQIVLELYPGLSRVMDSIIVAMNHEFGFDEDIIPSQAEIAMFPPVSGGEAGGEGYPTIVEVVDQEIDINQIAAQITLPATGGICIFTGTVRGITNQNTGKQTEYLVYEAYRNMAEAKLLQICAEIRSRWSNVKGIALVQRVGKLMPGAISMVVACSSSHRDEGIFEAARYGIDRVKEIVPVWKKEVSKDGEEWIEGEYFPHRGE